MLTIYLVGLVGVLAHGMLKIAPGNGYLKIKPSKYKIRVLVWGVIFAIIGYTIMFWGLAENALASFGITIELGKFTAALMGFVGSSLFQNIAAKFMKDK